MATRIVRGTLYKMYVTDNGVKFHPKCKMDDCILMYVNPGDRIKIKFSWGQASGLGIDEHGFHWISDSLYEKST